MQSKKKHQAEETRIKIIARSLIISSKQPDGPVFYLPTELMMLVFMYVIPADDLAFLHGIQMADAYARRLLLAQARFFRPEFSDDDDVEEDVEDESIKKGSIRIKAFSQRGEKQIRVKMRLHRQNDDVGRFFY